MLPLFHPQLVMVVKNRWIHAISKSNLIHALSHVNLTDCIRILIQFTDSTFLADNSCTVCTYVLKHVHLTWYPILFVKFKPRHFMPDSSKIKSLLPFRANVRIPHHYQNGRAMTYTPEST